MKRDEIIESNKTYWNDHADLWFGTTSLPTYGVLLTAFPGFYPLFELGVFFAILNYICLSFVQIHALIYSLRIIKSFLEELPELEQVINRKELKELPEEER